MNTGTARRSPVTPWGNLSRPHVVEAWLHLSLMGMGSFGDFSEPICMHLEVPNNKKNDYDLNFHYDLSSY